MDPISTLSVATAYVQFIDFGGRFVGLCRNLIADGTLPELRELEARAKTLSRLRKNLVDPTSRLTSKQTEIDFVAALNALKLSTKHVKDAARKCYDTATELSDVLQRLQTAKRGNLLLTFQNVFKLMRQQKYIEKLEHSLEKCRKSYDSAVLRR